MWRQSIIFYTYSLLNVRNTVLSKSSGFIEWLMHRAFSFLLLITLTVPSPQVGRSSKKSSHYRLLANVVANGVRHNVAQESTYNSRLTQVDVQYDRSFDFNFIDTKHAFILSYETRNTISLTMACIPGFKIQCSSSKACRRSVDSWFTSGSHTEVLIAINLLRLVIAIAKTRRLLITRS